jgi:DNA-binding MarR family transcriptional regulator
MSRTRDGSLSNSLRSPALLGWLRLMRVYQRVNRASGEQLKGWDLSLAQFDVLAHVGAAEGTSQQELADSLLVTKGNVCQLLDKMEGRGLILRRQEGRTNRLFLSEEGRRLYEEVVPAHRGLIGVDSPSEGLQAEVRRSHTLNLHLTFDQPSPTATS